MPADAKQNAPCDQLNRRICQIDAMIEGIGRTLADSQQDRFPFENSMSDAQPILVTAGILLNGEAVLICQRHHSDRYGLQWEFPGGKVHNGEDLQAALRRELVEELAIEAEVGEEVFRLRHRYPDRYVEVVFLAVSSFHGTIENRVFEAVEWAPRRALPSYDFLEADRELVHRIARGEIV
jgi:8-oxo-dGTP diphosphatase